MSKADSIKAKLKNLAIKENKQFDYLLMLYFIERLLYRLSISKYSNSFVLKGGLLLYTILDEKARATKDVDFLARQIENTLEKIKEVFINICEIETDDAVILDTSTIEVQRIKEDADYEGVRVKVIAKLDNSKKVLQFDIGFGDVIIPSATQMEYPSLLDMDKPIIKAYSLESVIAEKFEAMIYLAEVNSRMKDFYDIYSICKRFDFDGRILFDAVKSTFERRSTPLAANPTVFTEGFVRSKEKRVQWLSFKSRINTKIDVEFDEVIVILEKFLKPIYDCIKAKKEFEMHWDSNNQLWV